jgi:hypothetical protein
MRVVFTIAFALTLAVSAAACVGAMPSGSDGTGTGGNGASQDTASDAGVSADLAPGADLSPHPLPADLGSTDLAGLVNCYGMAVCDPTTSFCIVLHSGSATNPGTMQAPACYAPVDCMGANMNCDCITQDPVLGGSCVNCVDHMDGTYDCYAQP